jgi:hypothetical protein
MVNGESERDWEDFEYIIEGDFETGALIVKVNDWNDNEIFKGSVKQFSEFCYE